VNDKINLAAKFALLDQPYRPALLLAAKGTVATERCLRPNRGPL